MADMISGSCVYNPSINSNEITIGRTGIWPINTGKRTNDRGMKGTRCWASG